MSPKAVALRNIPTITTLLKKSPKIGNITRSMSHRGRHIKHQLKPVFLRPVPQSPLARYLEGDANSVLKAA